MIEWAGYEEMIGRIGHAALAREWPRWRARVRSAQRRRALDFVMEWIPNHHPELLAEHLADES